MHLTMPAESGLPEKVKSAGIATLLPRPGGPLILEEEIKMAFAPTIFKKNDIDKWFGKNIEITASVYRNLQKEHGTYSFGEITEVALDGNKKAIRHLHAALRKNYKSPWREI